MSEPEARRVLQDWADRRQAATVELTPTPGSASKRTRRTTVEALGYTLDTDATLHAAMAVGGAVSVFEYLATAVSGEKPVSVSWVWKVDKAKTTHELRRLFAKPLLEPPLDSRLVEDADGFHVTSSKTGLELDAETTAMALGPLVKAVVPSAAGAPEASLPGPAARVVSRVLDPRVSQSAGDGPWQIVSQYRTRYARNADRTQNLVVACRRINGHILAPGDVFSYNDVVGPREEEGGFRTAMVIVRGVYKPGVGGGICQVSSTIYNAALLADMEIVSRSHHGTPVAYVPAGLDATVAFGVVDFRFRNRTPGPLAVMAQVRGGYVEVRLLGTPSPEKRVSIVQTGASTWPQGTKTLADRTLPPGVRKVVEKGHAGCRVTTLRLVEEQGRPVRRETISRDYYAAFPRIIAVGVPTPSSEVRAPQAGTSRGIGAPPGAEPGSPAGPSEVEQ
ncbi:MAG: VanW family protein [Armatimonadetes bacterium]|nr:VanW family protein [Armatimonadota bacterium]